MSALARKSALIACIIAYNEEKLLPGCLESLRGKVDRIVLVDGRIAHFPGEGLHSSDATADIALSYGASVIQADTLWSDEITMRNAYLAGSEGDWYLMIDADETVITPLPKAGDLPDSATGYRVPLFMLGVDAPIYPARLFQHRGVMEYRDVHHALFSDGRLISHPDTLPTLGSVVLLHRQPLREKARWKAKRIKRQLCYEQEKEYRERYKFR